MPWAGSVAQVPSLCLLGSSLGTKPFQLSALQAGSRNSPDENTGAWKGSRTGLSPNLTGRLDSQVVTDFWGLPHDLLDSQPLSTLEKALLGPQFLHMCEIIRIPLTHVTDGTSEGGQCLWREALGRLRSPL